MTFQEMGRLDAEHRAYVGFVPQASTARAGLLGERLMRLDRITPVLRSRYLVKGWLDRGASSVVYAESNAGKTFLAMDLALHIAAGEDWHGARVREPQEVVYIAAEGGTGLRNRVEAVRRHNPALAEAAAPNFHLLPEGLDLCTANDAHDLAEALSCHGIRPGLIVIDTLARTMGNGDENTAKDMGLFIRSIDALRAETGAHVMVIHHSGKDASKGARGSGSLRAAVDTEIELTRTDGIIMAETRKQRDMACDGVFAFQLKSVFLGFDEDGDRVTSAVVTPCEAVTRKSKVRLTGTDKIGMQALSDALAHHGEVRRGDMFPRSRQCVPLERWREFCDRHSLSSGEGESSKRTAFHKLKNRLQDKEIVRIVDGYVWRVEGDDRSQGRGNAVPEHGNASAVPFPSERGTPENPANASDDPNRSHRSLAVPGNAGNAGHAAVPTVPALYKSGNEGTLTQPGNGNPAPSPAMSGPNAGVPADAAHAAWRPDPDAFDPEMWQ